MTPAWIASSGSSTGGSKPDAVITNFLNPWILGRSVLGACTVLLCCLGLAVAWKILSRWRPDSTAEAQIALERRAELVAAIVQVALGLSILGLVLLVVVAERLTGGIRGAMCAYGVFSSTSNGFVALVSSGLASAACAQWLVLHRLDLSFEAPVLTPRKFLALFYVAPIVLLDFGTTLAFFAELDFSVVASCCSVSLDGEVTGGRHELDRFAREAAAVAAVVMALVTAASAELVRRRPGGRTAYAASALAVVATLAMVTAVLWYVAPHAYGTPHHLCPFCLLKADVGGIGWAIFSVLFVGLSAGAGLGTVQWHASVPHASGPVAQLQRRLARWTAIAFVVALVLAAMPVVRFLILSGGASVYGDL